MRTRMPTVLLALAGLAVAIAVGLAANAIASRSFSPGADALPSAGSLAPPPARKVGATAPKPSTASPKPAAAKPKVTKPATQPKPSTMPVATTTATVPRPVATVESHGGSGKGKGSSSHGDGKHSDD